MVKSNQVQLLRESHTRALYIPQKSPNRAKIRVFHGTPKKFPRSHKRVFRVQWTHLGSDNWKIKQNLSGLVTRRLHFFQKSDTFWPKFPSWGIWPIYGLRENCVTWRIWPSSPLRSEFSHQTPQTWYFSYQLVHLRTVSSRATWCHLIL